MAHNNLKGSYRTTRENMMKAYDKLPPEARRAFSWDAVENWVPQPTLTRLRRGRMNAAGVVAQIARWNESTLAEREKERAAAIGPYKGNVPDSRAQKPRFRV